MVICLEQGADLHMAQRISLPLTVSCFSKIQIGFTFLVPAHPGSPGQRAVKRVCVCMKVSDVNYCDMLRHEADLDSFFGTGDMLIAEALEWNEARHSIVKPRPNTDSLAWTAARVEVTPYLYTDLTD